MRDELQERRMKAELTLEGVCKSFETPGGLLTILDGVDLSLSRGDAVAITGPSGVGKSTLLYLIGGLEPPSSGLVEVLGRNVWSLGPQELAEFRNQSVGFVFQDHYLLPQLNVLENVLVPAIVKHGVDARTRDRAKKLLDRVGLGLRAGHRPDQLSGGERQRAALCRALINDPLILLADEPTGNLDPATATTIGSLLLELAREQSMILLTVTHSQELAGRFPRNLMLLAGKLTDRPPTVAPEGARS
jgi:lipoprotein-releasing system ATP-binding protein